MCDVEMITEINHQRAREKELGARHEAEHRAWVKREERKKTIRAAAYVAGGYCAGMGVLLFILCQFLPSVILLALALAAITVGGTAER